MSPRFTEKQGQYLAFIANYTAVHRRAPAEAELQAHFGVSPPSVHQMILRLEDLGLIEREPGRARSIRLLVSEEEIRGRGRGAGETGG
jgi:Mn-dependent DtxR family transcriptional regulator